MKYLGKQVGLYLLLKINSLYNNISDLWNAHTQVSELIQETINKTTRVSDLENDYHIRIIKDYRILTKSEWEYILATYPYILADLYIESHEKYSNWLCILMFPNHNRLTVYSDHCNIVFDNYSRDYDKLNNCTSSGCYNFFYITITEEELNFLLHHGVAVLYQTGTGGPKYWTSSYDNNGMYACFFTKSSDESSSVNIMSTAQAGIAVVQPPYVDVGEYYSETFYTGLEYVNFAPGLLVIHNNCFTINNYYDRYANRYSIDVVRNIFNTEDITPIEENQELQEEQE